MANSQHCETAAKHSSVKVTHNWFAHWYWGSAKKLAENFVEAWISQNWECESSIFCQQKFRQAFLFS